MIEKLYEIFELEAGANAQSTKVYLDSLAILGIMALIKRELDVIVDPLIFNGISDKEVDFVELNKFLSDQVDEWN